MVGLELMVTARGKPDIMKRWVGGQSVLVLHVECEHFKTYVRQLWSRSLQAYLVGPLSDQHQASGEYTVS